MVMLDDDEDTAFQADLARAIAASLEPDTPGPRDDIAPGKTTVWGSLLAAGAAARLEASGRRCSSDADSVRAGRCTPALLSSDDEEEEDDDFARQLAAAKAASLQSAQEEHRRRSGVDDTAVSCGAPVGGGGYGMVRGLDGNASWEVRTSLPVPRCSSQPRCTALPAGHAPPEFQPQAHPQQRAAAPPSSPTGGRHVGGGGVWCSGGLRLKPLEAAACLTSPFAVSAATPAPVAASVTEPACVAPSAQQNQAWGGATEAVAVTQAPVPCLPLARSAPLPSSPRLLPVLSLGGQASCGAAWAGIGAGTVHYIAAASAALDPLASSPGKHARTPSLAGTGEQAARLLKRSRPASDSGLSASPSRPPSPAHSGPAVAALAQRGRHSGGPAAGPGADAAGVPAHPALTGPPLLASRGPGSCAGARSGGAVLEESWPRPRTQSVFKQHTQSPERPASAASTGSGSTMSLLAPAPGTGSGSVSSGPPGGAAATTDAATAMLSPPDAGEAHPAERAQTRDTHTLLGLGRQQPLHQLAPPQPGPPDSEPGEPALAQDLCLLNAEEQLDAAAAAGMPAARHAAGAGQQWSTWLPDWQSWQPGPVRAPAAAASGHGDRAGVGSLLPRFVAPALDLSRGTGLGCFDAQQVTVQPAAADLPPPPPVVVSAADRRLLLHQRVWWWLGPGQAQPGRITSIDRRSEPLLFRVRLESEALGGSGGDDIIATADCLLPYVSHGERVMCRLPPPLPLAAAMAAATACSGSVAEAALPSWEEAERAAARAGAAPPASQACGWMMGTLQHCVFDGPMPRVHVLLGPEGLPYTLPYEYVVPVEDAAEGSGCGGSAGSTGAGWQGAGSGAEPNACMEIVPVD